MTTRVHRQVLEDLDYLTGAWPNLVTMKIPGTGRRRPAGRHEVSDAQHVREAELAAREAEEDRATRHGALPVPPTGPIPAPAAPNVLDLLARFASVAEEVAVAIAQTAGIDRPPAVESAWTDPRPYFQFARAWLTVADAADDRTMPWVAEQLHPLADAVAAALGEVHDGQVLDAVCPWCGGRTERSDRQRTLVVFARGARRAQIEKDTTSSEGPVIVCHGVNCEPPTSSCGMRVGDHPAWPEREWEWLAKHLLPVVAS